MNRFPVSPLLSGGTSGSSLVQEMIKEDTRRANKAIPASLTKRLG
jgi:hypothetical protein